MLVWLSKQGDKKKAYTVHRLVASMFIENHSAYKDVNHKDGNKKNNNVSNLEWCTRSQNIKHSYSALKRKRTGKKIVCIETKKEFCSIK